MATDDSTTPLQQCSRCLRTLPATPDHFRLDKRRARFRSRCRDCDRASAAEYRAHNREADLTRKLRWYYQNRERASATKKAWYRSHQEHVAEYREAHREHYRRLRKARYWRQSNKERQAGLEYRRANPQKVSERLRRYRAEHPEKERAHAAKRRALKSQSHGTHTPADVALQYRSQCGRCWWCGTDVGEDYHVDHLIPLTRGGGNGPENLVISCPSCNMRRQDKLASEWAGRLF